MSHRPTCLALLALAALSMACAKEEAPAPAPQPVAEQPAPAPEPPSGEPRPAAMAEVQSANGDVTGTVTFRDTGNGIAIEAKFSGLTPGAHGFHVHEKGECSGDFTSAGPHFNPGGHAHAGPDADQAHSGDLGNLRATAEGNAQLTMLSRRFTLDDGPSGVIGRAVIVHESEDDLATQPTGNSGARIACGIIRLQEPEAPPALPPPAGAPAAAAPAPEAATEQGEPAEKTEGGENH